MTSTILSNFGDPTAFAAALNDIGNIAIVTRAPAPFRAKLTHIVLPKLSLLAAEENQARIAFICPTAGRIVIMLPSDTGDQAMWNGAPIPQHEMLTIGAGARPHWCTRGAARWIAVCLSAEALAMSGQVLTGKAFRVPQGLRHWFPSRRTLRPLMDLCRAAVKLTEQHPALPLDAGASRGLEQELLEMLVECLETGRPEPDPPLRQQEAALLERLEDLLRDPARQDASPADLFAALGASEPGLRACFRAHLGIGPRMYIQLWRARSRPEAAPVDGNLGKFTPQRV